MLNFILTKNEKGISSTLELFSVILLIIFGLSNTLVTAQTHVGNLSLLSQAEVDAFNYTEVTGFLEIFGGAAITNLDSLSSLTTVGGFLDIFNNQTLTNLDGLSSLTSVGASAGGGLLIEDNAALTNLDGLSSLTSVGYLQIHYNAALTEFCGLYTLLSGNGVVGIYSVGDNAVNPTQQEIIDGGPCVTPVVVCPLPQGYWKKNPWPVDEITLGSESYTYSGLVNILNMPVGKGNKADASLILAKQLIAAKLNIENEAEVSEDVLDAVDSADGLIGSNTIPMGIQPKTPVGKQMTSIAGFLESYNKGELNEGCTLSKPGNAENTELTQSIPADYVLEQNYPNPFNPATTISWQLPVSSHVSLKVYDILGNEVASLVNENREAGYYEVSFVASALTSGMYTYRLTTSNYNSTKKMLLIK